MQKKYEIVALGELLLRLSAPDKQRIAYCDVFEKQVGGAEFNVVAGAANLGFNTAFISKIPANEMGYYVINQMKHEGVDRHFMVEDHEDDARLGIYYYEKGVSPRKGCVVYDRKSSSVTKLSLEEIDPRLFSETRCFHVSGITLALHKNLRDVAIELIKKFKEHGAIISFDVNFRANLWSEEEAKDCIESILEYVDIFFCSQTTAELTFKKTGSLEEVLKSFTDTYPIQIVAATQRTVHSPQCHSFTSMVYDVKANEYYTEAPYENIQVVDRIGSGDAYILGFLYGLLKQKGDTQQALLYGNAMSAFKNTIHGDITRCNLKDIEAIIKDQHTEGWKAEMKR